jgi:hypothetical protein
MDYGINYGQMLKLWLQSMDDMSLSQFAEITGHHLPFFSSLSRKKRDGGMRRPIKANQDRIFQGLAKALTQYHGSPQEMNSKIFWEGPPGAEFQQILEQMKSKVDLAKYITETPDLTFDGKRIEDADRPRLLKVLALHLERD